MHRVDMKKVEAMIQATKEEFPVNESTPPENTQTETADSGQPLVDEPLAETCSIDDFVKIDLRVARVIAAEEVPEARKLLKLQLSLGGDVTQDSVRGHQAGLRAGAAGRPAGRLRGESSPAADEIWPQRRDGRRQRPRRERRVLTFGRRRRPAGAESALTVCPPWPCPHDQEQNGRFT